MKKIIISAALMCLTTLARAETANRVIEVVGSSWTVNVVTVSSYTGTQMDSDSIALSTRAFIAIQNLDADYAIYCAHRANVTTSTGFMVPMDGGIVSIPLRHGDEYAWSSARRNRLTIYCITSKDNATTKAAVIQGY